MQKQHVIEIYPPYAIEGSHGAYTVQREGIHILTPTGKKRTWRRLENARRWCWLQRRAEYVHCFARFLEEEMADTMPDRKERQQRSAYSALYAILETLMEEQPKDVRVAIGRVLMLCAKIETPLGKIWGTDELPVEETARVGPSEGPVPSTSTSMD